MMLAIFIIILLLFLSYLMASATGQNAIIAQQPYAPKDYQNGNIDIVLEVVDEGEKIATLKKLRLILKIDLKTSKHIIDNAPIVIIKNINEEQAQDFQEEFNNMGIKVTLKNN